MSNIQIAMPDGPKLVDGQFVPKTRKLFAVTGTTGCWTITHVTTGYAVKDGVRVKRAAIGLAQAFYQALLADDSISAAEIVSDDPAVAGRALAKHKDLLRNARESDFAPVRKRARTESDATDWPDIIAAGVFGDDSDKDTAIRRAGIKTAVCQQIFCPETNRILDQETAVLITNTKTGKCAIVDPGYADMLRRELSRIDVSKPVGIRFESWDHSEDV
jgi:hypothetical protein